VNNENFENENMWVPETPYDIRDEGMNDFLKALKTTKAKKDPKKFHFKFRSKKDSTQSIAVLKKHWGHKRGVYSDILDSKKMKAEMDLPDKLGYDSRLIKTRLNKYYLCTPKPIEVKSENQAPDSTKHCTISLDPGVRTFMTGYDADGSTFEWAQNDFGRIFRLCYAYDVLQAKWSQKEIKHHQRYKMKISGLRIHSKIRNLVDEVHKKLSKCLCENYRKIVLPVFETSNMVKRGMRKLHKKTARAMLTWSHYRFRQRLLSKSREYPWCKVILTEEPYTSKTCGECGTINTKLGSNL
jgi:putative transposase